MCADAQAGVLILLGGLVLGLTLSDTYLLYVKSGMRLALLVSGVVALTIGFVRFLDVLRAAGTRASAAAADPDGPWRHDGGDQLHHVPRAAWLLALPVVVVALIAPAPLGSYAAQRQGPAPAADGAGFLLTRFRVGCCAADGFPVQVAVSDVTGAVPSADTWVEVIGTIRPGPVPEDGPAELSAGLTTPVPAPDNPYETA